MKTISDEQSWLIKSAVTSKFIALFNTVPLVINSPGRINLIGEHTDYNNGYVMPAAINRSIQIALSPSAHSRSVIYSMRYHQSHVIDISNPLKVNGSGWPNYLLGIVHQLNLRGCNFGNFNCVFDGDLPTGAGLSSSAALECGFVFGLNELFRLGLSPLDMIHIAQWAEHHYAGVKCGIMDQFASMMGKQDHVIMLDCRDLSYRYFPLHLGDYRMLLCDTNVKHSLASSEYNTRRRECEKGVAVLKTKYSAINSLRDVTEQMLSDCRNLLDVNVYNRCLYVVQENGRVIDGARDLEQGRIDDFGRKMFETHAGLSALYDVSCPELDFLIKMAKTCDGIIGARMMGGGFGGCTLNIIHRDSINEFVKKARTSYHEEFGVEMTSHVVELASGTAIADVNNF